MNTEDTEALGNYIKMINKSNDEPTKANQTNKSLTTLFTATGDPPIRTELVDKVQSDRCLSLVILSSSFDCSFSDYRHITQMSCNNDNVNYIM